MSRKIPRATKDRAFRLWLQGYAYREIRDRTGMSLGAINQKVADVRRETPDVDRLRELNVVLRKGGSNVYDAMRGGRLLDKVGQLGVSLDELESYVKLVERISREKEEEAGRFVESALKLMDLEGETGKTYGEITKDFEGKVSEVKRLGGEKSELQKEIHGLKGELTKTEKDLSSKVQELKSVVETEERLKRMGLEKLAHLAVFVEGYEALGFSAQQVQKLVEWRKGLAEMGIDPDKLAEFIKKKGSLEKHILNLGREKRAKERKVKELKEEHTRLWNQTTSLRDEISRLTHLGYTLKKGKITLPCKVCRMYGISLNLASVENALMKGSWCSASCIFCGQWSSYAPLECAWYLAQLVLPAIRIRPMRNVAKKR